MFFKDEGYRISVAENGKDALSFLRDVDSLPDLILLDLMMPVMDGYQFRIEQEKDSKIAEIPVVIMTAGADAKSNCMVAHAQGFLKKPFASLDQLLSTIDSAL